MVRKGPLVSKNKKMSMTEKDGAGSFILSPNALALIVAAAATDLLSSCSQANGGAVAAQKSGSFPHKLGGTVTNHGGKQAPLQSVAVLAPRVRPGRRRSRRSLLWTGEDAPSAGEGRGGGQAR